MILPRAKPQSALGKGFCLSHVPQGAVLSTPYLTMTSEVVGSCPKSLWISVAALRKCRSRGPGVRGRLAAGQEQGVGYKPRLQRSMSPCAEQEQAADTPTDPGTHRTETG